MPLSRRDFLKIMGASAAAPLAAHLAQNLQPQPYPPNVLILVFDTLSARHINLYGYPRQTMPNLTHIAQQCTVYHQHWATGNFTSPGTASLLTGLYPQTHRGFNMFGTVLEEHRQHNLFHWFQQHGYHTLAYTHNPLANILLTQFSSAIDQLPRLDWLQTASNALYPHFEHDFNTAFWSEQIGRGIDRSTPTWLFGSLAGYFAQAIQQNLITARQKDEYPLGPPFNVQGTFFTLTDVMQWAKANLQAPVSPFLHYLHFFPPHEPYAPRTEFLGQFNDSYTAPEKPPRQFASYENIIETYLLNGSRRIYDAYLADIDAQLGEFWAFLQTSGRLDDTIIVITSDHGQLFERGIHGHLTAALYEGLLHVPLLIHTPAQTNRADVHQPTSAVDILPTLAHLCNLPHPNWAKGILLPPLPVGNRLGVRGLGVREALFALEAKESSKFNAFERGSFAARVGKYKIIHYRRYELIEDTWELYDLEDDPEEQNNRFATDPLAKDLQALVMDTFL